MTQVHRRDEARRVFAAILALFAAQGLVALMTIPPWQNPDEPQHVMTTRLVARHGADFNLERDLDPASERAIVDSMARHGWWRHYGAATPDPVPTTFADGPAKVVGQYFGPLGGGSRMYYRAFAGVFGAASIDGVLEQLYVMRLVSALATLLTLWFVWSGTRRIAGGHGAAVVATLLALHPQFVFVSTSASPDAFVNLAGAVVWRQTATLLSSGFKPADVGWLWAAALAAFILRRLGAPLLAIAAVVTVVVARRDLGERLRWRALVWAVLAAGAAVAAALFAASTEFVRALAFVQFDPSRSLSTSLSRSDQLPAFFDMLYRTFWLAAGWLQYQGPAWWHSATVALCIAAAAGIALRMRRPETAVALAAVAVAIQVAPIVAYHFGILESGPQGRYLFPVLPPLLFLMWRGWSDLVGRFTPRAVAPLSLVAFMAALNASAWGFVVLPAYT